ncbi:protein strawberry notch homolog 1-like isoform X2 [Acanthaster planci]|nr:protein strawberry notch homolog 1-like isoform X2 [Acanthaster planci]
MNGLAEEGQDLLLAALSESGLAFDEFPGADPNEQNDFDLSLLGPPDPVETEQYPTGFQTNVTDPLLEMLQQQQQELPPQQQQLQPRMQQQQLQHVQQQPALVSAPTLPQMQNLGNVVAKLTTSSDTNSGTVYVMDKNRSMTPAAPQSPSPVPSYDIKPDFFRTIATPGPPRPSPATTAIGTYQKPVGLSRIKTAPAGLSALLDSIPSTSSHPLGFIGQGSAKPLGNSPAAAATPANKGLSQKDVSRLWSNDDIKLKHVTVKVQKQDEEDIDEDEEENMGHAETYANYRPSKLKIGLPHPDPVVETSSMASVQPPNIFYRLSIPEEVIDRKQLSALQLESVTYACQQHETLLLSGERAGYLIGDGAGVGKGRTIAGIIYENYLQGRKRSIWFSVSNDLKFDAERDLRDISARILVHSLNKFKYDKISSQANGHVKKGVIFSTYSSLIGESQGNYKYHTRLKQLLNWCGKDFDGVIIFDECHKAKNLVPVGSAKPTKTGLTVLELQKQLPKARVVYCSATGASEPRNMAYMSRLGIWGKGTPFPDFQAFIQAVERRGVGAMEIVAMDMKLRGMYIARQLSFQGVTFNINEVPLSEEFKKIYNRAVSLWLAAREKFTQAADLIGAEKRMRKSMWGQFWSAHQRFFKYLCIAAKVQHAVRLAREAVKIGKCVVIGLQSTGEARTLDALEEAGGELNDFVSTAKSVFMTLIEKHFPAPNRKKTANLFGLNSNSGASSPALSESNRGIKRKRDKLSNGLSSKQPKHWWEDNSLENSPVNSNGNEASGDSDESVIMLSSSESEDDEQETSSKASSNDEDDFNPFGDNSDDDPWLTRKPKAEKTKTKKKKKKPEKRKEKAPSFYPTLPSLEGQMNSALYAAGILTKTKLPDIMSSMSPIPAATNSMLLPGMDAYERAILMKQELLDMCEDLGPCLPNNTLDELIDELGGPENVAEMTGRKGRVVSNDDGYVRYESRSEYDIPLETLNLTEKQRFMNGDKQIAIISEAASSGISLQADKRVANQRRRVHITLELPWSADRAIQQFGRTHRSNQVHAPEYIFLISELAGERRFASIVAKRLESMGALTHGDRRATETRDLSMFNIDNKYGRAALESVMKSVVDLQHAMVPPPADYKGNFLRDAREALIGVGMVVSDDKYNVPVLDKDSSNMSKFLNRILGMEVEMQNQLFAYFTATLDAIVQQAKRDGKYDMGILDIGSMAQGQKVRKLQTQTFVREFSTGTVHTELHKVSQERGLSWDNALDMWSALTKAEEGFYISSQPTNNRRTAVLVKYGTTTNAIKKKLCHVYKPNIGLQGKMESLSDLSKKYHKVLPDGAQVAWEAQYSAAEILCSHAYWRDSCKKVLVGLPCEIGLRRRNYYILAGSVLSVWDRVEKILATQPGPASKMQILRLQTDDGSKIVGIMIPSNCIVAVRNSLLEGAHTYVDNFEDNEIITLD